MRVSDHIYDLGEAGAFLLTLQGGNSASPSLPAERHARACLLLEDRSHDRLEICTRPLPRADVEASIAALRSRWARAVSAVHANFDWVAAQVTDAFREPPAYALSLGGGRMLLCFLGHVAPWMYRVIDAVRGEILWEESYESLVQRFRVRAPSYGLINGEDHPLLHAGGGSHVALSVMMNNLALVVDAGGALQLPAWHFEGYPDVVATRDHFLLQEDREKNEYTAVDPATGTVRAQFEAPTKSRDWTSPVATQGSERAALPHKGGTIDIVDGFGAASFAIRPFTRVARGESLGCRLSFGGGYLETREWTACRMVDLERRKVAQIDAPGFVMNDSPGDLVVDPDIAACDSGVYCVDRGHVTYQPYASLPWQPVVEPGAKRPVAGRNQAAPHEKLLPHWRRPALTLSPQKRGTSRSRLYGLPDLPAVALPKHEGEPMLLLAQLDLAEVAAAMPDNPWPKEGVLAFFVAVDGESEPLVDEMFNPEAVRVVWHRGTPVPAEGKGDIEPQPLKLAPHAADLPDITSVVVAAAGLEDAEIESYREYLEKKSLADQPGGHRLGGYPTILQNNDLEAQAAHFGDDAEYPPADLEACRAAAQWRLLLQLDSDDVFMWGTDSGTLYVLIRDDDLAKGNFSRVVAVCEGC